MNRSIGRYHYSSSDNINTAIGIIEAMRSERECFLNQTKKHDDEITKKTALLMLSLPSTKHSRVVAFISSITVAYFPRGSAPDPRGRHSWNRFVPKMILSNCWIASSIVGRIFGSDWGNESMSVDKNSRLEYFCWTIRLETSENNQHTCKSVPYTHFLK